MQKRLWVALTPLLMTALSCQTVSLSLGFAPYIEPGEYPVSLSSGRVEVSTDCLGTSTFGNGNFDMSMTFNPFEAASDQVLRMRGASNALLEEILKLHPDAKGVRNVELSQYTCTVLSGEVVK